MNKRNIEIEDDGESEIIYHVENVPVNYKNADDDYSEVHENYIKEIKRNEKMSDILDHLKYSDMWSLHLYTNETINHIKKPYKRWHYTFERHLPSTYPSFVDYNPPRINHPFGNVSIFMDAKILPKPEINCIYDLDDDIITPEIFY